MIYQQRKKKYRFIFRSLMKWQRVEAIGVIIELYTEFCTFIADFNPLRKII
jgi:hypothetical protein